MAHFEQSQIELARSLEFFEDPDSYQAFDLDSHQRRAIGCIDPRDQDTHNPLKVVVQTAGGAAGEGTDAAIALRASGEMPEATINDGLMADITVRHMARLCAHHACKYMGSLGSVLREMAEPQQFTEDTIGRWGSYYGLADLLAGDDRRRVAAAAGDLVAEAPTEQQLLEVIDDLYPDASNVVAMRGENKAGIYVVNHHPHIGLDRERKHRGEQLEVQGYHDSLAASISDLQMARLRPEVLRSRLVAHIVRAAAVRTLIGGTDGSTVFLEVQPTEHGPQINEVVS